jgi:hypothetical protein
MTTREVLFDRLDEADDFEVGEWVVVFGVLLVLWRMPPEAECVEDVVPLDVVAMPEECVDVEGVDDAVPPDVLWVLEECVEVE